MACRHVLAYVLVLLEFVLGIHGRVLPKCQYQEYACGSDLSKRGYTNADLRAAIAKLPSGIIPPTLSNVQLLQVLYHCDDIYNSISGNAFCVSGCIAIGGSLVKDDKRDGNQINNNVQEWLHYSSNQEEGKIIF
ncbi:unnamed protein product [Clonostachys rosea]|uniref:Killer toxin Kp4 domain-containing protein n=1 Tax=Bionectria ochroleuca TaxID=29856 RepID=A0ABY6UNU9_BIOOC|nr:unnamed protein product [Clonostachys rosea]